MPQPNRRPPRLLRHACLAAALLMLGCTAAFAQGAGSGESAGAFAGWELSDGATLSAGNNILDIDSGTARAPGSELTNGSVEFEVWLTGQRAFVYLQFRIGEDGHREEIYLRGHKSHAPDALQYTPVIGASQWQLFHGEGGTAAASLPAGHWIKVRAEFFDRKLAVFVGDQDAPAMVIPRLTLEPRAGAIGLRAFIARGSNAPIGARFRNVRIGSETTVDWSQISPPEIRDPKIIRDWMVGPLFQADTKRFAELPATDAGDFRQAPTEPSGVVLLHRFGRERGITATVVKLDIESDQATIRALDLGFSDAASVFLNGRPLVSLDQSYSYQRPRVQGVIGFHQARLHLPLERGKNRLEIVVADSFGGFGIMGRWAD